MEKCIVYLQNKVIQSSFTMTAGDKKINKQIKLSSETATIHFEKFSKGLACLVTVKPLIKELLKNLRSVRFYLHARIYRWLAYNQYFYSLFPVPFFSLPPKVINIWMSVQMQDKPLRFLKA